MHRTLTVECTTSTLKFKMNGFDQKRKYVVICTYVGSEKT